MSGSALGISGVAARADVSSAVSMAVAAKALDQARSQGAAVVKMIRAAGDVQKSAISVASRAGGVDTYA
ncbi:MAG: putative motility protein [Phycisphaerales bacterium]|nr:putative motility protein [Phycisphaerales bacterium]